MFIYFHIYFRLFCEVGQIAKFSINFNDMQFKLIIMELK